MLPSEYRKSRGIEQVKKTWDPILRHEIGRHWEMIKEGMKGFSMAHDDVLKALAKYERDETAEMICREFLDNVFPSALDVVAQLSPVVNKYPSYFTDAADMTIDNSDARSVTMGPVPGSSSRPSLKTSMGPPPRPCAPMIPEFGPATRGETKPRGEGSGKVDSPSVYDLIPDSPLPDDTDHGPLTLQQNGKRSRDTSGTEAPPTSETPNKRARKANRAQRNIEFDDVTGVEYIFKDNRCGYGHYDVIRCNVGKYPALGQPGVFVTPPLESNTALDHYNKGHACHDTTKDYSIDDIIHEFAHRVTKNGQLVTIKEARGSNEKLQKNCEEHATNGSSSWSPKGKERATEKGSRSVVDNIIKLGTDDDDESFWDEVSA